MTTPVTGEIEARLRELEDWLRIEARDFARFSNLMQEKRTAEFKARGDETADYRGIEVDQTRQWKFAELVSQVRTALDRASGDGVRSALQLAYKMMTQGLPDKFAEYTANRKTIETALSAVPNTAKASGGDVVRAELSNDCKDCADIQAEHGHEIGWVIRARNLLLEAATALSIPRREVDGELLTEARGYLETMKAHTHCCGTAIVRKLIDVLSAQPLPPAGGWRDIATAPKDGTWVLGFRPGSYIEDQIATVRWYEWRPGYFFWQDHDDQNNPDDDNPTHWQPLPAPPALDKETT